MSKTKKGVVAAVGRPTLYRPEYCKEIIEYMKLGNSVESFAGNIEVSKDTIYEWAKVHKEFSDALSIGKMCAQKYLEDKGHELMMAPPNSWSSNVYMLFMKNRFDTYREQKIPNVPIINVNTNGESERIKELEKQLEELIKLNVSKQSNS